jgi:hypothetical protein
LFNLKRKVKNKAYIEALICKTYIVEEISTFISYYFESQVRIKIKVFQGMMMVGKCL